MVGASLIAIAAHAQSPGEAQLRFIPALDETFQNNQRGWNDLGSNADGDAVIERGFLTWSNRQAEIMQSSSIEVPVAGRRPYEITLDLRHLAASPGPGAGLQWAVTSDGKTGNRILVSADGNFAVIRREDGRETELASGKSSALTPLGPVRLTLRVLGPRSVLFLNGVVAWVGDSLPLTGSRSGVVVAGGASVEFDNLIVRHVRAEDAVLAERLAAYTAGRNDPAQVFLPPPAGAPVQTHVASTVSVATLAEWEQEGSALLQARKFREAAAIFRRILAYQPESPSAHYSLAWCLLALGDAATARQHAEIAVAVEPLGLTARALAFYTAAAVGDEAAAAAQLRYIAFFDGTGAELAGFNTDLDILAAQGWRDTLVAQWRPRLTAALATRQEAFLPLAAALNRCNDAARRGATADLVRAAQEALAIADALPPAWKEIGPWVANFTGNQLATLGDARSARPLLERAFVAFHRADAPPQPYLRTHNAVLLANASLTVSDPQRAFDVLEAELPGTATLPAYADRLKGDLLNTLCRAAGALGKESAQRQYAAQLLAVTGTGRDAWYQAWAHFHRAGSFASTRLPPEVQEMKTAYERALALAASNGFDDLADSATYNLALVYWKLGEKNRARDTYFAAAEREEKLKHFAQAEVLLNNLGALYLQDRNYPEAAAVFRRAVALTERERATLKPEERVAFLATRTSAYQFLIAALHHTGGSAELFEVENGIRARNLAEILNLRTPPPAVTLAAFQASLAPDEAAIFYTVVGAAEVVAHVVTADSARSAWCDGRALVAGLKAKHLDRFHAQRPGYKPVQEVVVAGNGQLFNAGDATSQLRLSDFESVVEVYRELIDAPKEVPRPVRAALLGEFSAALGEHLLGPVAPLVAGKSKLIVFPDGILNFVPFEALPVAGRHLVEQFDVRYVQSAPVWSTLRSRHYPDANRRSFLGMGGALYAAGTEQAAPVNDAARHVQLQIAAQRNVQSGASQREIYAALFGPKPMNYLQGSLVEVQELGRMFANPAIFTGADMSEPRLKAMARDGSLAQFRIVHLATHGFAIPEVPELSGLAMTLLPTAEGGEDGYLTAPEIARLGMKADLAVLSACQTALGRIYGGEGVAGLTGSLLLGGANRALVSLWPVSDAGTMYFMRDVHALVLREGVSYDVAANRVKRRFIAGDYGEQFRDVYIWAPFVHYGL